MALEQKLAVALLGATVLDGRTVVASLESELVVDLLVLIMGHHVESAVVSHEPLLV